MNAVFVIGEPPACRYGHGALEEMFLPGLEAEPEVKGAFALVGLERPAPVLLVEGEAQRLPYEGSDYAFVVRVFRCAACGYVELFDAEASHGS